MVSLGRMAPNRSRPQSPCLHMYNSPESPEYLPTLKTRTFWVVTQIHGQREAPVDRKPSISNRGVARQWGGESVSIFVLGARELGFVKAQAGLCGYKDGASIC